LTISRSSSVSPLGFFQSSMSRCMLISCGIQWFAQPARYLSHAHLYLNGTSWLTSVRPLMMRLSAALTRRNSTAAGDCAGATAAKAAAGSAGSALRSAASPLAACMPTVAMLPALVVVSSNCNILELLY
jgi:hypothetical protein